MNYNIPRDLILENPANYDEFRFKTHLNGVMTVYSLQKIYDGNNKLYKSFFTRNPEHAEVAFFLLKHVIDTTEGTVNSVVFKDVVKKKLLLAMYEAGFFG